MSQRTVEYTDDFRHCLKRVNGLEASISSIMGLLQTFHFQQTTKSDRVFVSPQGMVDIWELRLASNIKNKGSSGGFRMLVVKITEKNGDEKIFLYKTWERKEMNKPKIKHEYQRYLDDLRRMYSQNF